MESYLRRKEWESRAIAAQMWSNGSNNTSKNLPGDGAENQMSYTELASSGFKITH